MKFYNDNDYSHGMTFLTDTPKKELKALKDFNYKMESKVYSYPLKQSDQKEDTTLKLHNIKMRKVYELLDSKDEELLSFESTMSVLNANRVDFKAGKKYNAEFREAFKNKETIMVLNIGYNGIHKHIPIRSERTADGESIKKMHLLKKRNTREFKNQDQDEEKEGESWQSELLEDFYTTHEDFDDAKGSYMQIFTDKIVIFNRDRAVWRIFSNFYFVKAT